MADSYERRAVRPDISVGFAPIVGAKARVLILGSLPGRVSLAQGEYYAQPRNAFWRIMGDVYGAGPDRAYEDRCVILAAQGVALWDVCRAAIRPGSLDADIDAASVEPNDFATFLAQYPDVDRICCNGAAAHRLFSTRVRLAAPALLRLPSTSPAHAAVSYAEKLAAWRAALL